jgi:hypothetical protein
MFATVVLLSVVLAATAEAEPQAEPDLAAKVRRLVRQLDAPQLRERDRAEEELLQLGPKVLPLLPKEPDPTKPEVDQRVGRIRQKLQRTQATASVEPSTVTLQGKVPLSKVFDEIQKQTGNKIVDLRKEAEEKPADPEINVDFQKVPFWQALDRVLDEAKMTVYAYGEEKAIRVAPLMKPQTLRSQRACYRGPFRFEPISIVTQRDLRRPENDSLNLNVEVAWEPRLAPITLQQKMGDLKAADENGRPVAIERPEAEQEMPIEAERLAKEFTVPLKLPPRDVKQIARLQGKLSALVPGKLETFRFTDLEKAKNVEKRIAGVTVVLEGVRKSKKLWEVHTTVRFDEAGDSLASHRTWASANPAVLEDKNGKQVAHGSSETTKQTANELGVMYLFYVEEPIGNYAFVYKTPGMIFSAPVEYELQGIELP